MSIFLMFRERKSMITAQHGNKRGGENPSEVLFSVLECGRADAVPSLLPTLAIFACEILGYFQYYRGFMIPSTDFFLALESHMGK